MKLCRNHYSSPTITEHLKSSSRLVTDLFQGCVVHTYISNICNIAAVHGRLTSISAEVLRLCPALRRSNWSRSVTSLDGIAKHHAKQTIHQGEEGWGKALVCQKKISCCLQKKEPEPEKKLDLEPRKRKKKLLQFQFDRGTSSSGRLRFPVQELKNRTCRTTTKGDIAVFPAARSQLDLG